MTSPLALLGGPKVRSRPFPSRVVLSEAAKKAGCDVLQNGALSLFLGAKGARFHGGPRVLSMEKAWAEHMGYAHAISVNSWTSGLMACVGALKLDPGDEVICAPYTMSATATAILLYGGVPVFADVEPDRFCLDPDDVERKITPRTKAIMAVHLFGGVADLDRLVAIAERHALPLIEDAAQAPGALWRGKPVGAAARGRLGLGGFSLNYHKHIHCGEGGVIVTDDDELAHHCRRIRNHGENDVDASASDDELINAIGGNYRLTEPQAAIAEVELDRLDDLLITRRTLAERFLTRLSGLPGVTATAPRPGTTHAYYAFAFTVEPDIIGCSRDDFVKAVQAELPKPEMPEDTPLVGRYVAPLYMNPVYRRRIAIGSKGWPFSEAQALQDYGPGLCPVVERLYGERLVYTPLIREPLGHEDVDDLADAIEKVAAHVHDLRAAA